MKKPKISSVSILSDLSTLKRMKENAENKFQQKNIDVTLDNSFQDEFGKKHSTLNIFFFDQIEYDEALKIIKSLIEKVTLTAPTETVFFYETTGKGEKIPSLCIYDH